MANKRLSEESVRKMRAPETGRVQVYDAVMPGLVLRVSSTDVRSWSFVYRINGAQKRLSLGQWPGMGVALAREHAGDAAKMVQRGEDPVAARKAEAETARTAVTVAQLVDDFTEKHIKRNMRGGAPEAERLLRKNVVPVLGKKLVKDVTAADVRALLDDMLSHAPVSANRTRTVLHKLFDWAMERDIVTTNVVKRVAPVTQETAKDRVLSDAELVEVWHAAGKLGWPFGNVFRLLMVTAARRSEIAELERTEVAPDGESIVIKAERMKAGLPHVIALSSLGQAELAAAPMMHQPDTNPPKPSVHVFTTNGTTPVSGWSRAKSRIDKLILDARREDMKRHGADPADAQAMPEWTVHDLRRTAATGMARIGIDFMVIGAVLAHSQRRHVGITATYARHRFDVEKKRALEVWGMHLQHLLSPKTDNVVSFPASA
ncbi:integrase [Inquilinus ginsengisoli]|uniref:tyrosine-type recombinase/integrase n=1 Tax=Inquilinus ginsengisoli TaxID=363840 RepID=UPI003D241FEF